MTQSKTAVVPRRRVLVVAVVLLAAACSVRGAGTTPPSPSPSPTATDVGADATWGPLAVVPPAGGSDGALIEGTLRVTADCVLLDEQGDDVLLVWPENRTIWTPEAATVSFLLGEGQWATFADGDRLTFGGGGSSVGEGGLTDDEWVASIVWVSEPEAACVTDTRWFVGDVVNAPASGLDE